MAKNYHKDHILHVIAMIFHFQGELKFCIDEFEAQSMVFEAQ